MKFRGKSLKVILLLALSLTLFSVPSLAQEARIAPNVILLLPDNSQIKVNWVLPPVDKSLVSYGYEIKCFSIDADGLPWVGVSDRLIINPVKQWSGLLSVPFASFFHLDTGALFIATDENFGYLHPSKDLEFDEDTGWPLLPYQPVASLPATEEEIAGSVLSRKMFRGQGCLYFLVERQLDDSGQQLQYEVYLLKPEEISGGDSGSKRIKAYQQVLISEDPVTAVSGNGDLTFVAQGNLVFKIEGNSPEPALLYEHPTDIILALDYSREAGLFYATNYAVGVMAEGSALEFLKASSPQIFLQGTSLYVMFSGNAGMIKMDDVHILNEYNRPGGELIAVDGVKLKGGSKGIAGLVIYLVFFVLLLVTLIDVLKNKLAGSTKIVWVLMILVGFMAQFLVAFLRYLMGYAAGFIISLYVIIFLILSAYYFLGRRQRL